MQLDKTLISRLEKLAKLKMSAEEEADLLKDLNQIMQMIDHIQDVDVSGIEPLRHLAQRSDVTRPDVVEEPLDQNIALKNGPDTMPPYFRVPNVLDGSKKKMKS
jgi:aspartyl-tRNA(Asn)/glutamyl-tRNA(Gln) amidotransferase subunit C